VAQAGAAAEEAAAAAAERCAHGTAELPCGSVRATGTGPAAASAWIADRWAVVLDLQGDAIPLREEDEIFVVVDLLGLLECLLRAVGKLLSGLLLSPW